MARSASDRGLFVHVFVFSIFVNILMLTGPLFMLQVYDRVLASRSEETLVALFVLVAALYGLMGVLDYARAQLLAYASAQFRTLHDAKTLEREIDEALDPAHRAKPAQHLQRLDGVQGLMASPALIALFDIPWTPLFFAAIFIFHPLLGWFAIAGGVTLIALALANNILTRSKVEEAQGQSAYAGGLAQQARAGSEIIRAQGMGPAIVERWIRVQRDALAKRTTANARTGGFAAVSKTMRMFLQSAMLALGAWLVLQGEATAGAMIASSIVLGRALAPIEQALGQWPVIVRGWGAWQGMRREAKGEALSATTSVLPRPEASLVLKNVSLLAPGTRTAVLQGISLAIKPGDVVGVIGQSGMGKSSLAKLIVGLAEPVAGEVRLGGATLAQYDPEQLGHLIGYLPQNVTLFSGTVGENIARMSTSPDDEKIYEAAKRANAHEMILSLPDGYKTMLHGNESQLSGGQKQRLGLARALYGDPVLLVLDEPNSALDVAGTHALNKAVRDFKAEARAVMIMTHRPQAIAEADRIIVMERGRITADGPKDEVLKAVLANASSVQREAGQGGKTNG